MILNLPLSDDAERLLRQAFSPDVESEIFKSLLIEGYRRGKLSTGDLCDLLGYESRIQAEKWLGEQGVEMNYGLAELEEDRKTWDKLDGR